MNWGWKIIFIYGLFMTGILTLVIKSSSEKIDLVETGYYEKELRHQDRINEINNYNSLTSSCQFELTKDSLIIDFPTEIDTIQFGEIHLYCPSNSAFDLFLQLPQAKLSHFAIPLNKDLPERFNCEVRFTIENKNYYHEEKLGLTHVP
jgi:hypothetical protein